MHLIIDKNVVVVFLQHLTFTLSQRHLHAYTLTHLPHINFKAKLPLRELGLV